MKGKPQRIAVISGGPKAVAIAAKAAVLRDVLRRDIRVTIFERYEIGARWTGRHGYTIGDPELCTPAERDLGFPYRSGYGNDVDQALYAQFSWGAFAVANSGDYGKWVDAGRGRPSHRKICRLFGMGENGERRKSPLDERRPPRTGRRKMAGSWP